MKNLIVDLDGTLADGSAREKMFLNIACTGCAGRGWNQRVTPGGVGHDPEECPECEGKGKTHMWTPYFEACDRDLPNERMIKLMKTIWPRILGDMYIMTGRCESVRQKTEDWLNAQDFAYDHLLMRPIGNRVDDHILKIQWGLEYSPPEDTLLVFEDRQRVVDAWRSAGYTCLQVAPGAF